MANLKTDLIGTITLTSGSADFTTSGMTLSSQKVGAGDRIYLPVTGLMLTIDDITGENAGTLTDNCPAGAAGADQACRIGFSVDVPRFTGALYDLLALLKSGNVDAFAGLTGAADKIAYFTGANTMDVTGLSAFARTLLDDASAVAMMATLGIREVLTANRTYYVRTDGSDSHNGLSNTAAGAFLTIQKAVNAASMIDLNGYAVTIQVGAGTYTGAVACKPLVGGVATIVGDQVTPSNVLLNVAGTAITNDSAGVWTVAGLKLQATGAGLAALNGATIKFANIDFGACTFYQIQVVNGGNIVATGNYTISGGAATHISGFSNGNYQCQNRTITLTGTPAFSGAFISMDTSSAAVVSANTYSGSATGPRYNVSMNGAINTGGGGASYFPGSSVGGVATGGQYA